MSGDAYQYIWYSPWGEGLVDQYSNTGSYSSPYRFNAKELDPETNNYYYGARFYNPQVSQWLSVDPKASKLPEYSPYVFCNNNPVVLVDPNGEYPIHFITRSYAPFKTFGPGNSWYGDNRGHSLDRNASYRSSVSITYDTETRRTVAKGGESRSHTVDGSKDAISPTNVNYSTIGNEEGNVWVHSAGKNNAQPGAFDIDQFTKLKVSIEGDMSKEHILNISGTVSGDDFPNQESMVYDSEGNGVWLGNFNTSGDKEWGPVMNLPYENEEDVNMNINIRIKVNSEGVFQGVVKDGKTISIDDWNAQF